jgi:hypothetical protein
MWPNQLAFLLFIVCTIFLSSFTLYVTLLHFSHDRSNWSSPFFSSTTFQNFPDTSDLLSEVFKFQHHTKLRSKRSISLHIPIRQTTTHTLYNPLLCTFIEYIIFQPTVTYQSITKIRTFAVSIFNQSSPSKQKQKKNRGFKSSETLRYVDW